MMNKQGPIRSAVPLAWWLAAAAAAGAGSVSGAAPAFSAGYDLNRVRLVRMTETGDVKTHLRVTETADGEQHTLEVYDRHRMSSWRHLVHASAMFYDRIEVTLLTGLADLETQSNEGEVTHFAVQPLLGANVRAEVYRHTSETFMAHVSAGYLGYRPTGGQTVYAAKHQERTGGDLRVRWEEWDARGSITVQAAPVAIENGIRFRHLVARQERMFSTRRAWRSKFTADDPVMLFTEVRYELTPRVALRFGATYLGAAEWHTGATFTF